MSSIDLASMASRLINHKLGGLTLNRLIQIEDEAGWYEATEDLGVKRLVYIYLDEALYETHRPKIRGLRTSFTQEAMLDGSPLRVFVHVGNYQILMPIPLRRHLMSPDTWPRDIAGYLIEDAPGHGYKGVTFKVRKAHGPSTPYALKLTIAEEYQSTSYMPEIDRMVALHERDRDHFPAVFECGTWMCDSFGESSKLIYFVEEFIHGVTLRKYLVTASLFPASIRS